MSYTDGKIFSTFHSKQERLTIMYDVFITTNSDGTLLDIPFLLCQQVDATSEAEAIDNVSTYMEVNRAILGAVKHIPLIVIPEQLEEYNSIDFSYERDLSGEIFRDFAESIDDDDF